MTRAATSLICEHRLRSLLRLIGEARALAERDLGAGRDRLVGELGDLTPGALTEEGRLLALLSEHGGWMLQPFLADQPRPRVLTARRRQTLELLLRGRSEKEIAAELGLSPHTVHEHVGRLYRHFGVRSRAELLARFVARSAGDPPK